MADKHVDKEVKLARKDYPGAAIDAADDNRVEKDAVCRQVKNLNNNPRTTDQNMP